MLYNLKHMHLDLSFLYSELVHQIQNLLHQPATRRAASFAGRAAGFTIVELLIVIVIIGILAGIVIMAYNGIQNTANDTVVNNDLAQIAKKMEKYKIEAISGTYPGPTELEAADLAFSKNVYNTGNNYYYCYDAGADRYILAVRSKTGQQYKLINGTISPHATTLNSTNTCQVLDSSLTWNASRASAGYNSGVYADWVHY